MGKITKAVFEDLNKSAGYILTAYSILCFLLIIGGQTDFVVVLMLLFSFLGFWGHYGIALGAIIISGPFISELSSGYISILPYIPFSISVFVKMLQRRINPKPFGILFFCFLLVFMSYLFGYNPDSVYLLLQIVCIFLFYTISQSFSRKDVSITIFSYICSGLLVLLFMYSSDITTYYSETGRLGFGEHVKTLAFICAIPMVFLLFSLLNRSYLFSNMTKTTYKIIDVVLLFVFLLAILMTLARGLLISVALGTLIMLIVSKKSGRTILGVLITFFLVIQAYSYVESLDVFRTERLFAYDEYASGNGRTEIWLEHITSMKELGARYVFWGVGPGNISRISNTDAYAHSMILDFFFSYGTIGFLTFIIIEIVTLKKLFDKTNTIPFVVILVFLIAYSTHGGAANMTFFILQGLMLAYSNPKDILSPKTLK